MRTIILAAIGAGFIATPALAQNAEGPRLYGSVGYAHLGGEAYDFQAVTGRVGAKFNPYFGVEGEASVGVSEERFDISIGGGPGKIEHKYDAAAYAVGFLPVNDRFEVFARVGYGTGEVESSHPAVTVEQTGESLNYGVGAIFYVHGDNGLRADWTRRDLSDDGGEVDVWSLNYIRRF